MIVAPSHSPLPHVLKHRRRHVKETNRRFVDNGQALDDDDIWLKSWLIVKRLLFVVIHKCG